MLSDFTPCENCQMRGACKAARSCAIKSGEQEYTALDFVKEVMLNMQPFMDAELIERGWKILENKT